MYDDHDCDDDHDIDDEDYDYGLVLGHASLETSLVTSRQLVIDNDMRDDNGVTMVAMTITPSIRRWWRSPSLVSSDRPHGLCRAPCPCLGHYCWRLHFDETLLDQVCSKSLRWQWVLFPRLLDSFPFPHTLSFLILRSSFEENQPRCARCLHQISLISPNLGSVTAPPFHFLATSNDPAKGSHVSLHIQMLDINVSNIPYILRLSKRTLFKNSSF